MNTTRLRELCDAFDAGTLRDEEMRELVGLAREAADDADLVTALLAPQKRKVYLVTPDPIYDTLYGCRAKRRHFDD